MKSMIEPNPYSDILLFILFADHYGPAPISLFSNDKRNIYVKFRLCSRYLSFMLEYRIKCKMLVTSVLTKLKTILNELSYYKSCYSIKKPNNRLK